MEAAVLLTCHGTVSSLDDVAAFLTNIRRGRPAPAEVVAEVARRLRHIGGSPLMRITEQQGEALERRLGVRVRTAGRLWHPHPAEVLGELVESGVDRVVSLPLAPLSVEVYHASVRQAAASFAGLEVRCVPPWSDEPVLVEALAETVDEGLARFPEHDRASVFVVLSAHSLPRRVIEAGDRYEADFRALAERVAGRVATRCGGTRIAFQSQGMTADSWLGPDLAETFAELARAGAESVLVAPIGFVADHVETLYDLDVEAPELAKRAGILRLERAPAANVRARFIDALEKVVRPLL